MKLIQRDRKSVIEASSFSFINKARKKKDFFLVFFFIYFRTMQETPKMRHTRYILLSIILATSLSYTCLDFYRMLTSRPEDHAYPIFYTLTVIWCAYGIISSIVAIHLLALKRIVANGTELEPLLNAESVAEVNWKNNLKKHTRTFVAMLLCISCIGLVIDASYFHLEHTEGKTIDTSRGIMLTMDIVQIVLYVFTYNMTLLSGKQKLAF